MEAHLLLLGLSLFLLGLELLELFELLLLFLAEHALAVEHLQGVVDVRGVVRCSPSELSHPKRAIHVYATRFCVGKEGA
jgi:hypothetical protein